MKISADKAIHDTFFEKGLEQGLEKGLEQGIKKTAQRMIKKGMDIEMIIEITGLTREQIEQLMKEKID